jgi:hypothetical protein
MNENIPLDYLSKAPHSMIQKLATHPVSGSHITHVMLRKKSILQGDLLSHSIGHSNATDPPPFQ